MNSIDELRDMLNELYNVISEFVAKDLIPLGNQMYKDVIKTILNDKEAEELLKEFIKYKVKLIKYAYDEAINNGFDKNTALMIALRLYKEIDELLGSESLFKSFKDFIENLVDVEIE